MYRTTHEFTVEVPLCGTQPITNDAGRTDLLRRTCAPWIGREQGEHRKVRLTARLTIIAVAIGAISCATDGVLAQRINRTELVQRMQHDYLLVKSIQCDYQVRVTPTSAQAVPQIRQVCELHARTDKPTSFIYTAEMAQRESFDARYWRQGPKERTDFRDAGVGSVRNSVAFDGQLVRQLEHNTRRGTLRTPEGAYWNTTVLAHPMSFLYEFLSVPYWQIMRDGASFESRKDDSGVSPGVYVAVDHPSLPFSFAWVFDLDGRLRQRDMISRVYSDEPPFMTQRYEFHDYVDHQDTSGERISFPTRVVLHYYMGELPDGTPVEYKTWTMRVTDIAFNSKIDDDQFMLQFPDDYEVLDALHGLGWTRAGDLPEVRQQGRKRRSYIIAAVTIPAGLLLLGGVVWWELRRRRAKQSKS